MDLRELKGLELAARARITFDGEAWVVPSQTGSGKYRVDITAPSCICDDFALSGPVAPCKHVIAARLVCERDGGGRAPTIDTAVAPAKKKYTQNWQAYNLAQHTEKHRFQVLLADLCKPLPELPYKGGRPRSPIADVVFAAAYKVYSTVSSRRFGSDLSDAHADGYMARSMHPNKVNAHLENPELTPILKDLIVRSALPLRAVEVDFAADSTGFSSSRFVRWYDEKYGVHRSGHDWVKVHAITGVKTNIITAAEVLGRDAADCPQFAGLVNATAKNFTISEVSGDKAYLSRDNLELVASLGGTPFIPFRVNSIDGDGVWGKMFGFFQYRREEFLAHYHKRSNVESTFSMIKAKFGDHVRSRTDDSMRNEALCKLLCHNICCVIGAQCELGIEPVFWGEAVAAG